MLYMMIKTAGCCITLMEPIVKGPAKWTGPVPGGVTVFPAFPDHERSYPPGWQPIGRIMSRRQGTRRCAGAIRDSSRL